MQGDEVRPAWGWRAYGAVSAWLGLPITIAWILAAVAATHFLPELGGNRGALVQLVPQNSVSVQAGQREAALFGFPLTADALVVQRNPAGMAPEAQLAAIRHGLAIDQAQPGRTPAADQPRVALPIANTDGLVPGSRERSTTVLTYLLFAPGAPSGDIERGAHRYAADAANAGGNVVGITGAIPAQTDEGNLIEGTLVLVELVTVLVVALVVGITFRSPIAPLVALAASAIAYLVTVRVLGWGSQLLGINVPAQLDPVIVVLLLAIVTDYSVFFLSGLRPRLAEGEGRTVAMRRASARVVPLVIAAAATVAAGTAALLTSRLDFFHALGPGMAVSVLIGMLVSITLVPALLAMIGPAAFWPSLRRRQLLGQDENGTGGPAPEGWRTRVVRGLTRRPVAALTALVCLAALGAAANGLRDARLGITFVSGLPSDSEARRAADAAAQGFAPGVVAPTVMLVEGSGIASHRDSLSRLGEVMRATPGVASVLGPDSTPPQLGGDIFLASGDTAARFLVVFDSDPFEAPAIATFDRLRAAVTVAAPQAGLTASQLSWTGSTPLAAETVTSVTDDAWRVALAAAVAMLIVLVLFLRAFIAALLVLVASTVALAAPLGLAAAFFQGVLGWSDLTFFVPVAAGVLLVSLGSDYSVFMLGRVLDEARGRGLSEAMVVALPRATRAVSAAGLALALSFAVLALVPVRTFREFAFIMAVGVLIDAFMVRSWLLPSLLTLVGRAAVWPRRRSRLSALPERPATGSPASAPVHSAGLERSLRTTPWR